jgi:hypothetical protein
VAEAILCGNGCGHDHNAPNGPSGCCKEHGPYLYHCHQCHEAWREANPEQTAEIEYQARRVTKEKR